MSRNKKLQKLERQANRSILLLVVLLVAAAVATITIIAVFTSPQSTLTDQVDTIGIEPIGQETIYFNGNNARLYSDLLGEYIGTIDLSGPLPVLVASSGGRLSLGIGGQIVLPGETGVFIGNIVEYNISPAAVSTSSITIYWSE